MCLKISHNIFRHMLLLWWEGNNQVKHWQSILKHRVLSSFSIFVTQYLFYMLNLENTVSVPNGAF